MQPTTPFIRLFLFLLVVSISATSQAQLFGPRTLGKPFQGIRPQRSTAAPAIGDAGTLSGQERFLRDNRSRGEFVGTDRRSLQGFVGSGQAIGTGRVQTTTETLQPPVDQSSRVNRPISRTRRNELYHPRIVLDGLRAPDRVLASERTDKRDVRLRAMLDQTAGSNIEVIHVDGRTILRGTVASEATAEKLLILASFEPHIDTIENQLVVRSN